MESRSRVEDDGAEHGEPALGQNLLNNVLGRKAVRIVIKS
jgi:hypothetical protein